MVQSTSSLEKQGTEKYPNPTRRARAKDISKVTVAVLFIILKSLARLV